MTQDGREAIDFSGVQCVHISANLLMLFGVKGQALSRVKMYPWVASVDSMAADYSAREKARQAGISNTIAHRASKMNRWMAAASRRAAPATGDQFLLGFNA
ncbi:hypothetical protein [Paraburkholderia youngii]|uniref:hypothetical protein n=1 Tax=Paraburkholderia youngii TaxID=2782701 RepID=UPI0020CEF324|nr:hypothetical protein [Paraburkholderia youngii]